MNASLIVSLRLTRVQTLILDALMGAEIVTHREMQAAIYGKGEVKDGTVKVHVHNLRRKIADLGVEIQTVWGRGYAMPEKSKHILEAAQ